MSEKTYTLEEAHRVLALKKCKQKRHKYQVKREIVYRPFYEEIPWLSCMRCGQIWGCSPTNPDLVNGLASTQVEPIFREEPFTPVKDTEHE